MWRLQSAHALSASLVCACIVNSTYGVNKYHQSVCWIDSCHPREHTQLSSIRAPPCQLSPLSASTCLRMRRRSSPACACSVSTQKPVCTCCQPSAVWASTVSCHWLGMILAFPSLRNSSAVVTNSPVCACAISCHYSTHVLLALSSLRMPSASNHQSVNLLPILFSQCCQTSPDDSHGQLAQEPVERPGEQPEGWEQVGGRRAVISWLQADGLQTRDPWLHCLQSISIWLNVHPISKLLRFLKKEKYR